MDNIAYGLLMAFIGLGIPSFLIGRYLSNKAEDKTDHLISGFFYFIGIILLLAFLITAAINMSCGGCAR